MVMNCSVDASCAYENQRRVNVNRAPEKKKENEPFFETAKASRYSDEIFERSIFLMTNNNILVVMHTKCRKTK